MCGLVGIFSSEMDDQLKELFRHLHSLDITRGNDSSGIFVHYPKRGTKKTGRHVILKDVGPPINMWLSDGKAEILDEKGLVKGDVDLIMGHNRKTTFGGTNKENAHPFKFGRIVGAHNGTLKIASLTKFGNATLPVDSMRMFDALAKSYDPSIKDPLYKDVESVLSEIEGAIAATWYNYVDGVLNFYRNDERPLHYALSKNKRTLVWASEEWMLDTAITYSGALSRFDDNDEYPSYAHRQYIINQDGEVSLEEDDWVFPSIWSTKTTTGSQQKNQQTHSTGSSRNFTVRGIGYQGPVDFFKDFECKCVACNDDISWETRHDLGFPIDNSQGTRKIVVCPTCLDAGWVSEYFGVISSGYDVVRPCH